MDAVTLGMAKADARRNLAPVAHASSAQDESNGLPNFQRVQASPILTSANSALPSIYWPWVVKVAGLISTPLAPYYMWISTDHDSGTGGIELWTAPAPTGPWTSRGVVYTDTVTGSQTETPSVVWNRATSLFHMYYQQAGAAGSIDQSTFLATSPDGQAWTRVGKVIDVLDSTSQPGDGHTGYFQPMPNLTNGRWVAYSLKGGSTYPHFGLWYSRDGLTWNPDPRPLGYGAEWYDVTGTRAINWNHCTIVEWRGRRLVIGVVSNFVAGVGAKDARMFVAPVSTDLRRLLAPPTIILNPTGTETPNYRACSVLSDGGALYLYYQTDQNIYLAKAGI